MIVEGLDLAYTDKFSSFRVPSWSCVKHGASISENPKYLPSETTVVIDIETDEADNIVCIGLTGDGTDILVYFDITEELINFLQNAQLVGHALKDAEIKWLTKYGITVNQIFFDTKIAAYVYDSSRKNFSLKPLLKDIFNVEYPLYQEIVTGKEFIEISCEENPELMVQSKQGPKYPKKLTLDKMHRDITIQYNACDVFWTFKLWVWFREHFTATQWNFYNTIELPTTKLIYEMEQQGIKIDTKAIRRIHNENSKQRRSFKKQLFTLAGKEFNPNSPKQVLPILQSDGMDIQSTGEEELVRYSGTNPLAKTLLSYRGLQKLCSTYTTPLYFNAIKDSQERIYPHFNQNTITGRLSSSDPINIQNQPQEVRCAFVAKEGHVLIGADWSNIELRLPAHLSGERGFIDELSKRGGDLHARTATFLFGDTFTKASPELQKSLRAKAKTCNFLLTNSGTASRLASELQCSKEEAETLYKKFWEGYPTMAQWLKEEKKIARDAGGVSTAFGRWVSLPQLKLWCGSLFCAKINKFCKSCFIREETERSAISIRVQGTASDMMKLAMLRLKNEYNLVPVLSVHDEIMYEVPLDKKEFTMYIVKEVMENITTLKVPLVAEVKSGLNWKDCH